MKAKASLVGTNVLCAYVDHVDGSLEVFMMISVGVLPFQEIEPNSGNACTATVFKFL